MKLSVLCILILVAQQSEADTQSASTHVKNQPHVSLDCRNSKQEIPSIASFHDFIARTIPINEKNQLRPVLLKPKTKLKKRQKLPNKKKNSTYKIAEIARKKELCPNRPEKIIQQIFQAVSLSFSTQIGLLHPVLTLSGDGHVW